MDTLILFLPAIARREFERASGGATYQQIAAAGGILRTVAFDPFGE